MRSRVKGSEQQRRVSRVLMLSENQPVPPDRRVLREARALAAAGHDVTVIAPLGDGQHRAEEVEGVWFLRYPPRFSGGGVSGYLTEYLNCLYWTMALSLRVLRTRGFDVIHAANPPDLFFLIAAAFKPFGKRFVFDQHDLSPELFESRFGSGRRFLHGCLLATEKATYRMADAVIVTNESYAEVARDRGRVPAERVFVVRNGPTEDWPRSADPRIELKRGRDHLALYVGVMGPQDGVEDLLHAVRHLVFDHGREDVLVALVGDGDSMPDLRTLADELGVSEYVHFVGWVSDEQLLAEYLATADICVCPEPSNPLNDKSSFVKVVEYMAAGKPVVACSLPETQITAGEAAHYAPSGDTAGLARAMATILDDVELRGRMADAAQRKIGHLRWESQLDALYEAHASVWSS